MATITLRVDDRTRDQVEALARARGVTVSDLLRAAIDGLLGRDVERASGDAPSTMTMIERHVLALQHEILSRLPAHDAEPEEERAYRNKRIEALDHGYVVEYVDEFAGVFPEMSRRDCLLVQDILDMFWFLGISIARLEPSQVAALGDHAADALSFRGFDANHSHEGNLLGYARYLIANGRWSDLAGAFDGRHERGNAHSPMLATYVRMLSAYQPIREAKAKGRGFARDAMLLDFEELARVYEAWHFPQ